MSHSLTLCKIASFGRRSITSAAHSFDQPQSQTNKRARAPELAIPPNITVFTSAMTPAAVRLLQRGHFPPAPCDQQLVRFSDAVIVKNASRSGTAWQIERIASVR